MKLSSPSYLRESCQTNQVGNALLPKQLLLNVNPILRSMQHAMPKPL